MKHLRRTASTDSPTPRSCGAEGPPHPHLVRLVAEVAGEGLGPGVCAHVFLQQGSAGEHLATGGTLVELFGVELLDVLAMLLQRGEAQTTLLTVVRFRQI